MQQSIHYTVIPTDHNNVKLSNRIIVLSIKDIEFFSQYKWTSLQINTYNLNLETKSTKVSQETYLQDALPEKNKVAWINIEKI